MNDTIYAAATARGRAGVAVIRISGPEAHEICRRMCGDVPARRQAALRNITWDGTILDRGLVLAFDAGASFTGEKSVEFQVHGSVAGVAAILRALGESGLARLAGPGDFTRRALDHGRLDLTQVEGLADLIDAETEAQRAQAFRTFSGAIAERVTSWRQRLVRAGALIEVTIDFSDEDVPVDVGPEVTRTLEALEHELTREIAGSAASEQIRKGFEVAIIGAPNVGKSTLLNRLAGRDAAITSEVAGTTRDVIEVRMDIAGLAVTVLDTAGLRDGADAIEREGIRRAVTRAEAADLRIFLGGGDEHVAVQPGDIRARAKADVTPGEDFGVSGLSGEGVNTLISMIADRLANRVAGAGIIVRERQREAVEHGLAAVRRALAGVRGALPAELIAEDLRQAAHALDALVGRVDAEDLLTEIFASFCIGK